jgi:alpha-D-ribose 1-methylphosphonate 5-triphosphate synthase subunit PhnG
VTVDIEARGEGRLSGEPVAACKLAADDIETDGIGHAAPHGDAAKQHVVIGTLQCHSSFIQRDYQEVRQQVVYIIRQVRRQVQTDIEVPRQEALGVLASADMKDLSGAWDTWENRPEIQMIRGPESGLIMLRGRTGGGGAPFNLGEATVSRASVRLGTGEVGHGYCLGRDKEKAKLIAVIDALFQREPGNIEFAILRPLRDIAYARDKQRQDETAATKVEFFTMVRGED